MGQGKGDGAVSRCPCIIVDNCPARHYPMGNIKGWGNRF